MKKSIYCQRFEALIVEDEPLACANLQRMLSEYFPEISVCGNAGSVQETVAFLQEMTPDVIFMDVELSDGDCFEVFRLVEVKSEVVMTTAYDRYALKAFEVGSLDYLLKPLEPDALRRAVERCLYRSRGREQKKRVLVHYGDTTVPVDMDNILCFYSEDKSNYLVTRERTRYMVDESMDMLEKELGSDAFFRINRGCMVSRKMIESVTRHASGRLKVHTFVPSPEELVVSRGRVKAFQDWLK